MTKILRGYLDIHGRAIVGLKLGRGEYVSAQVDTGFNGLLLFSSSHALELDLGLPEEYDSFPGAGGTAVLAGEVTDVPYYWFDEYRTGTILVSAPPAPGSLTHRISLDEQEPMALLGTRMLRGCHLSMHFWAGTKFPVKIRKLNH